MSSPREVEMFALEIFAKNGLQCGISEVTDDVLSDLWILRVRMNGKTKPIPLAIDKGSEEEMKDQIRKFVPFLKADCC
jgi:hypothetical protein